MTEPLHIRCTRFEMRVRVAEDLRLPEYSGSMLRGAFGHALRHISCVTRLPECGNCSFRWQCAYSYLFETPVPPGSPQLSKYPAAPHPWAVEAEIGTTAWQRGDIVTFSWVVFGRGYDFVPHMMHAWQQALEKGLGSRRAAAMLLGYRRAGETQWHLPEESLPPHAHTVPPIPPNPGQITLHFVTPFRGQYQGRLLTREQMHFRVLFSALQRRLGLLQAFHEPGNPSLWDYRLALEDAEAVQVEDLDLRWWDWQRYSSRQHQAMTLGGLIGHLRLTGIPDRLWPMVYLGQWTHVGKNASFGLGRYVLE
ncbi:MAG: CRISPR system precrRNA processing endoribonuclease RAMP protein Cas6 [Acidithiobacillus sp.]